MGHLFVIIAAGLAFLMGILLFLAPSALVRAGEYLNREIKADDFIFTKRLFFGLFLIALGIIMLYIMYT